MFLSKSSITKGVVMGKRYATDKNIEELRGMDANRIINFVKGRLGVQKDIRLAQLAGIAPSQISRYKAGALRMGYSLIYKLHMVSDIPIREIINAGYAKQELESKAENRLLIIRDLSCAKIEHI